MGEVTDKTHIKEGLLRPPHKPTCLAALTEKKRLMGCSRSIDRSGSRKDIIIYRTNLVPVV